MKDREYNIMSHMGVKDVDYAEVFGMPLELANTPEVNNYMISHVYDQNVQAFTRDAIESEGLEPELATKKAVKMANEHKLVAIQELRKVIKERGY